MDKVQFYTIFT